MDESKDGEKDPVFGGENKLLFITFSALESLP